MKVFLFLFTSAVSLSAQTPQISVTISPMSSGKARLVLRNTTNIPLTAFVLNYYQDTTFPGGEKRRTVTRQYRDGALGKPQRALEPEEQASFSIGGLPGAADSPVGEISAGIFQDGQNFGDPLWVAAIRQRRQSLSAAIDAAMADLNSISASAKPVALTDLVNSLEVAAQQKRTVAQEKLNRDAADAKSRGLDPLSSMFTESTPELKASNLKLVSDEDRRDCYSQIYAFVVSNLRNPPKQSSGAVQPDAREAVELVKQFLTRQRVGINAAKPTIQQAYFFTSANNSSRVCF